MNQPNVLILCVDDMNDWAGFLDGYPGVSTPAMDAIARRGVALTNAHCPSPLCNPSRTAIFTGKAPASSGVYGNKHWWRPALPSVVTMPAHFKAAGYYVGGAGKVFHHPDGFNPPDQWCEYKQMIFDDSWDRRAYEGGIHRERPDWHPMNGIDPYVHEFDWGVPDLPESQYGDVQTVDWAVDFLNRKHNDKPFFLAVGTFRPHLPCYAPARFFAKYPSHVVRLPEVFDSDLEHIPAAGQSIAAFRRGDFERAVSAGKWEEAIQAYLACISFADDQIGRVIAALDENALSEHTIVVFFSDNGFHLGEKNHWHKSTLWERATHVPFAMMVPRSVCSELSGIECNRAVSLLDIYPTLVELCGLEVPESGLDGRSLVRTARGSGEERPALINFLPGNFAVRSDTWRLIQYADDSEELYNCKDDPGEHDNLASDAKYSEVAADLREFVPKANATPVPVKEEYDFDLASYTWKHRGSETST